jgi:hypothetical protein
MRVIAMLVMLAACGDDDDSAAPQIAACQDWYASTYDLVDDTSQVCAQSKRDCSASPVTMGLRAVDTDGKKQHKFAGDVPIRVYAYVQNDTDQTVTYKTPACLATTVLVDAPDGTQTIDEPTCDPQTITLAPGEFSDELVGDYRTGGTVGMSHAMVAFETGDGTVCCPCAQWTVTDD